MQVLRLPNEIAFCVALREEEKVSGSIQRPMRRILTIVSQSWPCIRPITVTLLSSIDATASC